MAKLLAGVKMKCKPATPSILKLGACIFFLASFCQAKEREAKRIHYAERIRSISDDIEALKPKYPQLDSFSTAANADTVGLKIVYQYRTHRPRKGGGWTRGVPNPDSNGVWIYIDLHDPGSSAQLHTQPISRPLVLGDLAVAYLILEGSRTNKLHGLIGRILEDNGAYPPPGARLP